jgi:addiction module RelE/StbE family toxin
MSRKIRWAKSVLNKIEAQKEYIAEDSPERAKIWAQTIKAKQKVIKNNPFLGRIVPEFELSNYRELIIGNYRLVYVIHDEYIDFVQFWNCKENIQK